MQTEYQIQLENRAVSESEEWIISLEHWGFHAFGKVPSLFSFMLSKNSIRCSLYLLMSGNSFEPQWYNKIIQHGDR